MDIIDIIRYAVASPFLAFVTAGGLFLLVDQNSSFKICVKTCLIFGGIVTVVGLFTFIIWSVVDWLLTGVDSAQAPLAWLFFFGPISFAIGELVGFAVWCKKIKQRKE